MITHKRPGRRRTAVTATLRVSRTAGGIELRRSRFDIAPDGHKVAWLDGNDTVETEIEPGHHTLRLTSYFPRKK
jgi:hypothetical protein